MRNHLTWLLILLLSFSSKSATAQAQSITGYTAYICDVSSGSGTITFYTTNTNGLGSNYRILVNDVLRFTGSGGSNYNVLQTTNLVVGDIVRVEVDATNGETASKSYPVLQKYTPLKPSITPASAVVCGSNKVTLTAVGDGGSYTWSTGNIAPTLDVTAGTYTVKESNVCGTSPDSDPVVVTAASVPSTPTITLPSLPLCNGASGTLSANGTGGSYTWYNGAGTNIGTGPTISVSAADNYTVEESNACGSSPRSAAATITTANSPAAPTVTPAGPVTLCDGATQTLTATGSGVSWFLNGAANGSTGNTFVVSASGSYTAKASNGCGVSTASNLVTVFTNNTPPAPTLNVSGTVQLCDGANLTISTTPSTSGGTIHWSTGATGNSIVVSAAGTYYAYESNTTCGQGPNSATVTVTTNNKPSVPAISGNSQVCVSSTITLTDATPSGAWSSSDNSIATVNSSGVVTGVAAGTVTISYAVSNSCGTTTVTKTITVNALTVLDPITGLSGVCKGSTITLANTTASGSWSSSNTAVATVDGLGIVTGVTPGSAVITFTYTNGNGCTSTATKTITVWALPTISITATVNATNAVLTAAGATGYLWTSGEATQTISKPMSSTATYVAEGTDNNGCKNTASYSVNSTANSGATSISSSNGTTYCQGTTTTLTATAGDSYYWSTGETGQSITVGASGTYTVYVAHNATNIVEVASIVITVSPTTVGGSISSSATVCSGTNGATLNLSGHTGSILYWEYSTNGGGSWTTIANTTTQQTYLNLTTTTLYRAAIQSGVCPAIYSTTATITVNPIPTVAVISNQVLCNNASTATVSFTGAVGGTLYSWTNDNTSIGLAASGNGDIASFTAVNTGTTPVVATITVTPSAAGCTGTSRTFTITVNPTPTVAAVANQVMCNGATTSAALFTGTVVGTQFNWTNDNTSIGLAAAGLGDIASFTAVNTGAAPTTATITVTPSANGCTGAATTFTIKINPTPTVAAVSNQVLCNNASTTAVSFTGAVSGTLYSWTNSNAAIGLAVSGVGDILSFTATNTGTSPIISTITVTPSANGCTGSATTFTIRVNPTPTVANISNQVLCNNAATAAVNFSGTVTGTLFSWTNDQSSIGLASSGSGDIASFTAVNNGSAPITATITVTPSANGCTGSATTFTIRVSPTPTVAGISNQVLCNNAATAAVNFSGTVTGTLFSWTNDAISIGLAALGTGDIASFTAVNTGNSPVTATIRVTPSANGCTGAEGLFTIKVSPTPNVAPVASQVLCNNAATAAVNFSGTVLGTVFTWTNSATSIGLPASGTGSSIASFTAINNGSTPVISTVTVTASANGCTTVSQPETKATTGSLVVPVVGSNGSLYTVKAGATVLASYAKDASSNTTTDIASVLVSFINSGTQSHGYSASNTADIITLTAPAGSGSGANGITALLTWQGTSTITSSSTFAGGVEGMGAVFTIRVNPTPTVANISNQVLCNGAATTTINFTGTVTGTLFSWSNDQSSIGLAASGTGNIASFTATNSGNSPVIATIQTIPTANGCLGTTQSITIRVNPTPTVSPVASQVLCNTAVTTAINWSGSVAGTTFNWSNDQSSIGLAASGTGNIASFSALNSGSTPVTATIVATPVANGCTGANISLTIRVNPTPTVAPVASQVLCNTTVTNAINWSGSVAGTTFSWSNTDATIGLASSGAGSIGAFTAINNGSSIVIAKIIVTPSANGCIGLSDSLTIRVNPTPTVANISSQVLCNRDTTALISFTGTVAGTAFSWSNDLTSIGLAASGTGNIARFKAINNYNFPVMANISAIPSANGCTGAATTLSIRVNPTPSVNGVSSQVVCNGFNTAAVYFSGYVPGSLYTWTNSDTTIGLIGTGTGNISQFAATNLSNSPVISTIRITPSANGCTGAEGLFTIRVNPTPTVAPVASQELCNRDTTALISFTGTVAGTLFSWSNDRTSIGLAASGTGNIARFSALNDTTFPVLAMIKAIPSANGCTGAATTLSIRVNPTPKVSPVASQVLCNNNYTTDVIFKGPVLGTTYTWSNTLPSIGVAATGTGDLLAFRAINNGYVPVWDTVYVTPSGNGCIGATKSFTFRVNPTPLLSSVLVASPICDSTNFAYSPATKVNGASFAWSRAAVNGIANTAANGTGTIRETLDNNSNDDATVTYRITTTANDCKYSEDVTVLVHPKPVLTVKSIADVCDNSLFNYRALSTTVSKINISYNWTRPAVAGISNAAGVGTTANIAEYLNNTTAAQIKVPYFITMTMPGGCNYTDTIAVRVNPTPRLISSLTAQVCDYSIHAYTPVSNVAGAKFTWLRPQVEGVNNATTTGITKVNERLLNSAYRIVKTPYYIESEAAGCVGRDTLWTTVIPRPFGQINLSADTVKSGQSLKLSFTTEDTIHYRYAWEFGDKLSANTVLNPVDHIYNTRASKEYAIKTTITNRFSCIDTFFHRVYVIGDPKVTPVDTLAVERNYTMAAFPVPFTTDLRLKYSFQGPDEIAMYYVNDLAGRVVYAQKITLPGGNSIIKLPSEKLLSGVVYVIRVRSRSFDYEDKVYRK